MRNETIKVGKATGTFTDVLSWCGESEDEFNETLAKSASETERVIHVMRLLSSQGLVEAGEAWRQNNQDIVAVNEAQAELDEAMGRLGKLLAPLAADVINFGADALGALVDWMKSAIENTKAAYEWLRKFFDFEAKESRRHELLPGAIDGSHAGGLDYVPFDGYLAQLHRGEMVLTAAQAALLRSGGGVSGGSETISNLSHVISELQSGMSVPKEIYLTLRANDGTQLGRWLVPFVREENSANPEIVSDAL